MASNESISTNPKQEESGITLRKRKERKLYSDDWALGDEEIEGHHTFDLNEKVESEKFNINYVKNMEGVDFSLSYVQKHGFNWPLLFPSKEILGIVMPNEEFSINDIRLAVGSRRMLDVMDVNTQKNVEMTMKDWQRYYESPDKDKLLNVISLEFSHTKLETIVQPPKVVKQIDWVETVWPRHLKEAQTEATNVLEDMMYPKVQKYCLMSVKGCYTDFHIDFGGTSVWYHILKGKKIFWLIPPTERNLQLYEQWVLSGKQGDIFFGDTVDKCARIELFAGNTFFIPTGWIHAVYTPEDSLVFGGNFLHSFGIEKQLRVAQVEDTTHVPQKFRYPFFTEMLWYLLERYVHVLLGRSHLKLPQEEEEKYATYLKNKNNTHNNNKIKTENAKDTDTDNPIYHLTQYELHGLKAVVMYLHALPTSKKCVPELIVDPIALIRDVRTVVEKHRYDSPELAITDIPILIWWPREANKYGIKRLVDNSVIATKRRRRSSDDGKSTGPPPNAAKVRYRRIRCKMCDACIRPDCRECNYCKDMTRYGGSGVMKQTCKNKKCLQPIIGANSSCYVCSLDGWMKMTAYGPSSKGSNDVPNSLYECDVCQKVSHQKCLNDMYPDVEGCVNEDLPNCWTCPECISFGYDKTYKMKDHIRQMIERIKSSTKLLDQNNSKDLPNNYTKETTSESDTNKEPIHDSDLNLKETKETLDNLETYLSEDNNSISKQTLSNQDHFSDENNQNQPKIGCYENSINGGNVLIDSSNMLINYNLNEESLEDINSHNNNEDLEKHSEIIIMDDSEITIKNEPLDASFDSISNESLIESDTNFNYFEGFDEFNTSSSLLIQNLNNFRINILKQ